MRIGMGALGSTIDTLALAIQQQEGWYPGSRSYRNNNPGNLIYVGQSGSSGPDAQGFAVFPDYASGYAALIHQINLDAGRGYTFYEWMARYAPSSDGNNPGSYAQVLAAALGTTPDTQVAMALAGNTSPDFGGVWADGSGVSLEPGDGDWINQWDSTWTGLGLAAGALVLVLALR